MNRLFLLAFFDLSRLASAQESVRAATMDDAPQMASRLLAELFDGIPLSAAAKDKGYRVTLTAVTGQITLNKARVRPPGARYRLAAARDSALLLLVHSASDSAKYRENAKPFAIPRPRTP